MSHRPKQATSKSLFFTSPLCGVCRKLNHLHKQLQHKYGVSMTIVDVSTARRQRYREGEWRLRTTPTIIISGAQSARLVGDVSQAQIAAAIKAAIGTATPTPKVQQTPTAAPATVKQAAAVKQAVATPSTTAKQTTVKQAKVQTPSKTAVKATPTVARPQTANH